MKCPSSRASASRNSFSTSSSVMTAAIGFVATPFNTSAEALERVETAAYKPLDSEGAPPGAPVPNPSHRGENETDCMGNCPRCRRPDTCSSTDAAGRAADQGSDGASRGHCAVGAGPGAE